MCMVGIPPCGRVKTCSPACEIILATRKSPFSVMQEGLPPAELDTLVLTALRLKLKSRYGPCLHKSTCLNLLSASSCQKHDKLAALYGQSNEVRQNILNQLACPLAIIFLATLACCNKLWLANPDTATFLFCVDSRPSLVKCHRRSECWSIRCRSCQLWKR